MSATRTGPVPILAISARPADLLERLPEVYQVRQLVALDHLSPALWEQRRRLAGDEVIWQELDGLLQVARAERLPLLLDSRGMSVSFLARMLVQLEQVVLSAPHLPAPGVVGLVGGVAAQRVLALSPYVQGLATVTALWQRQRVREVAYAGRRVPRSRNTAPSGAHPHAHLPLPRGFLHVYAALPGARDMEQVSARSTYSRTRAYEILGTARRVLGLCEERGRSYDLSVLAHELTSALGQVRWFEHPSQSSQRMVPIAAVEQRMNKGQL